MPAPTLADQLVAALAAMLAEDCILSDLYTAIEPKERERLLRAAGMKALAGIAERISVEPDGEEE
jgi:hypothetical protein